MTSIYFGSHCQLTAYGATTKGGKTLIKVEFVATDHVEAGFLLRELQEVEARQTETRRARSEKPKKAKPEVLALPAPLLQLPYHGDRS